MTDGELLQLYAAKRDGEAFTEIVRRHGGMVHAAARRLARNETEDVTQAVFLLLAQRTRGRETTPAPATTAPGESIATRNCWKFGR